MHYIYVYIFSRIDVRQRVDFILGRCDFHRNLQQNFTDGSCIYAKRHVLAVRYFDREKPSVQGIFSISGKYTLITILLKNSTLGTRIDALLLIR